MNLKGKNVLITGSSSGIGAATASAFAKEGCNVVVHYRSNEKGALEIQEQVDKFKVKSAVISLTKTLAKDLAPNILVNSVAPGFTYTPNYKGYSEKLKQSFIDKTLIKKWIYPRDIAEGFVLHPASGLMNILRAV